MDRLKRWATLDAGYVASLAAIAIGFGLLFGPGAFLIVGGALSAATIIALAVARARSEDTVDEQQADVG